MPNAAGAWEHLGEWFVGFGRSAQSGHTSYLRTRSFCVSFPNAFVLDSFDVQ